MPNSLFTHQPLYREVLKDAFRFTWVERRYWVLALLAGILVTAGAYDIMWKITSSIVHQGQFLAVSSRPFFSHMMTMRDSSSSVFPSMITSLEALLILILLVVGLYCVSCVAQAALVYAIGTKRRTHRPSLKEAFFVGGNAFWPVVALNIAVTLSMWILVFVSAIAFSLCLQNPTPASFLVAVLAFLLFAVIAFCIAIIQIFSLNGMILQGATLEEAVLRGYDLLKQHWLIVLETAILQTFLAIGIWIIVILACLILLIPVFVLGIASVMLVSSTLFTFSLVVGMIFLLAALLLAAAFTIQLQYATWTILYRKLGEGGILPKLHRIIRTALGIFTVPE